MNKLLIVALLVATFLLWAKVVWAVSIQGRHRLRSKTFQYPEDAEHWGGAVVDQSCDITKGDRAQNMLRNDGESQPFFFVMAILYTWMNCPATLGAWLFIGYALLRWLHGFFLINPRQPHRNLAFSASLVIQLALLGTLAYQVFAAS